MRTFPFLLFLVLLLACEELEKVGDELKGSLSEGCAVDFEEDSARDVAILNLAVELLWDNGDAVEATLTSK